MLLIIYRGRNVTIANIAGLQEKVEPRTVSSGLLVGVIFLPIVFTWFLLRKGYSVTTMVIGLLWIIPSLFFWFVTLLILNAPGGFAPVESGVASAESATDMPTLLSPTASQPDATSKRGDKNEAKYIEILELAGDDPDGDIFTRDEGDPLATWESGLMTMGTTAKFYADSSDYALTDLGRSKQRDYKTKIGRLQSKAFPKLRSYYGTDLKNKLWEHDVDVTVSGPGNSTLRLTGFWFASNRNIKQIMESAHPDALALRFKRVEFRPNKFVDTTSYTLKSLPDSQLATISNNQWTSVE